MANPNNDNNNNNLQFSENTESKIWVNKRTNKRHTPLEKLITNTCSVALYCLQVSLLDLEPQIFIWLCN